MSSDPIGKYLAIVRSQNILICTIKSLLLCYRKKSLSRSIENRNPRPGPGMGREQPDPAGYCDGTENSLNFSVSSGRAIIGLVLRLQLVPGQTRNSIMAKQKRG
jgi:hypothetical protein